MGEKWSIVARVSFSTFSSIVINGTMVYHVQLWWLQKTIEKLNELVTLTMNRLTHEQVNLLEIE
jgi:hypothetical protein